MRESLNLVYPIKTIKHGDPVGDQRIVGLLYYMYLNKLYLSSTKLIVIFL